MKLLVTDIEFDFDDESFGYEPLTKEEENSIIEQTLGLWDVDSEDELVDRISDTMGWCVKSIDYQPNAPHSLTAFM